MTQINEAVQRVRTAAMTALSDADLLAACLEQRDETAFAALVQRHGPMVWGVCRRLLNHHDAEDAFQAVFLVLFRKAESIKPRRMISNWLYGVAHQAALHARRTAARRNTRERQVAMPEPAAPVDVSPDLRGVLDAELSRLPDKYRAVIVLCDLEGRTRKEAARHLGCAEGTVSGQLARGRAMLARRLRRHGLGVSGGALATVLAKEASAMPISIMSSTVTTVVTQTIPAKVVALAEGVIKAMVLTKLKVALTVLLALGLMATGAAMVTSHTAGQDVQNPAAEKPVGPAAKQVTAWGKEVGGLQAGLSIRPERKVYHHGEAVTLVVRVRNVGKETLKFQYIRQFLDENLPDVTSADGKKIPQPAPEVLGDHKPLEVTLAPGKEIELESRFGGGAGTPGYRYELRPAKGGGKPATKEQSLFVGTGKVTLQYEPVIGNSSSGRLEGDPVLKLATGKLELQVQDADDTAWGTPVGGLQAGISLLPKQRVYHYGDLITLSIRVRNVSKETVKFEYLRQFLDENPPTVTDADAKAVRQRHVLVEGFHVPVNVSLAPGQEIQLQSRFQGAEQKYFLTPADLGGEPTPDRYPPLFAGTGKVSLQYKQVLGDTSSGKIKLDPALSELGTGKLELDIKQAPAKTKIETGTAWGKEVDGLQCRLRTDKVGKVPSFKLVVRDLGKRDLQMHMAEDGCEIEFDGTWFQWQGPVSIVGGPWPAGRRYDDFEIPVSLGPRWRDGRGNPIKLTPGKHTVRVAYVTLDPKTPVRAVSNAVEITVAPR